LTFAVRVYTKLRELGFTHHQARACFKYRIPGGLETYGKSVSRHLKGDTLALRPLVDRLVATSFSRHIPREIGLAVLEMAWPVRDDPPLIPYTAIRQALLEIKNRISMTDSERQRLWHHPLKILRWEEASGVRMWDERLLTSYFSILGEAMN
tara:strand:+ start:10570 stop:11025 length:456 start_codon:yes stop_codon:yes gene_type:complete